MYIQFYNIYLCNMFMAGGEPVSRRDGARRQAGRDPPCRTLPLRARSYMNRE